MDEDLKSAADAQLIELIQICNICKNRDPSPDSYTAPAFIDFLDNLLTIEDIPMESNSVFKPVSNKSKDPEDNAWDDSIKNFVLDVSSVVVDSKFSVCFVLAEFEYAYEQATIYLLSKKYVKDDITMIYVTPDDEDATTFRVTIRRNDKIELNTITDNEYLISSLIMWYNPGNTLIFCHDTKILQYSDLLTMMPDSVWSVFCNSMNFIQADKLYSIKKLNNSNLRRNYICPIFSHRDSNETRAVGSGPIRFLGYKFDSSYIGSMNYYSKSIRGSIHSSGRCYDCQILHNLLLKLDQFRDKKDKSPIIEFVPTFLESAKSKQSITL